MKPFSPFALAFVFVLANGHMAAAQSASSDRLPALVRTNAFLVGQVLGCVIRLDIYAQETRQHLETSGINVPAQLADASTLLDMDASALKADLLAVMSGQEQGLISTSGLVDAIEQMARLEVTSSATTEGLFPAWVQTAGCATMMRQLGLFDAYPYAGAAPTSTAPTVPRSEQDQNASVVAALSKQIGACVNIPVRAPAKDFRGWTLNLTIDGAGRVTSAYVGTDNQPLANAVRRAVERCGPYDIAANRGLSIDAELLFVDR
jgi:hypothetical protein